ncbi:endo-1,4-beta-xylanase [Mycolicibacterium fluoranthenivorans]|uniref:endo-1,4-beta-xylanase n=1 Tax=Mycolicibacterium fluoranthenivorans TaxID=258505 RepID=A0A7G8PGL7_9MYCO|nr:endo-1,4-beta-xylanase [Mycolicibacterium fluoranthenivorans]QNJ93483.1 endo-1,4-beta-xylanase [Mycolicibacterium fluoranthenivorans]
MATRSAAPNRWALLIVAATCMLVAACTDPPTGPRVESTGPAEHGACGMSGPTLAELAERRGKTIGTAYRSTFAETDPCYGIVAATEFNSLTTEIGTMMNTIEPAPGVFDFREADAVADVAARQHRDFQIHALIWDPLDQPQWAIVPPAIRALPPPQRHQLMTDTVTAILHRYAGRASTVTVVNEAFDQMGHLQPTAWWQTTRSDQYIFDAFRAARLADPHAQLFYNDHSAETHSDKSNAIYDMVKRLHDTTVDVDVDGTTESLPLIDGIGFQAHMLGGEGQQPSVPDMAANLQRFADLGLKIRFTELDVRIPVVNGTATAADLDRQRDVFRTMTTLCLDQPQCTGITLWGFTDKRSWITDYPDTFSGYGAATPLTTNYQRKPARDGIAEALQEN